jgi:hypothetical protein
MNSSITEKISMFLFSVRGICGLEDYVDRSLLCSINHLKGEENTITCGINIVENDLEFLRKLYINRNYAISIEKVNNKEFKYYKLRAFEFIPIENRLILTIEEIQVEA